MNKFIASALAAFAVVAMAQPVTASTPIAIGMIDGAVTGTYDTPVENRDFIPAGYKPGHRMTHDGREHGDASLATLIDAANGKKIKVYHANIFIDIDGLGVHWPTAQAALDWFKQNNVKYVCTNFVNPEGPKVREFVDHAEKLGLILVTAIANPGEMPKGIPSYPASDPRTIAVAPNDDLIRPRMDRQELKLAKMTASPVAFGTNSDPRKGITAGTSFSAARVCGEIATR